MALRTVWHSLRGAVLAVTLVASFGAPPARGAGTQGTGNTLRLKDIVSLSRPAWVWSSIPLDPVTLLERSALVSDHAVIEWYNVLGVLRRDLKPVLSEEEGGTLEVPALGVNVLNPPGTSAFTPTVWTGLTQAVPPALRDFSRNQYLEIWVNDMVQDHSLTRARLHIDLGSVSEDAFWARDSPPNGRYDSEDKNLDGLLAPFEDTGLDGLFDWEEPGYDPIVNPDPDRDDYWYDLSNPTDYSHINGTERNGLASSDPRPDTEDLNYNGYLDLTNNYFEAGLDLSDSAFVAIDVARDYAGNPNVKPSNGWRLFRIPVGSATFLSIGSPSWDRIEHCRLWLSDMAGPMNVQIAGVGVLGEFPPETGAPITLRQNYPNPFNPKTTIPYDLSEDAFVRLRVYDVHGRLIRELVNGVRLAGPHLAFWSGRDSEERPVASGVYFYRVETGGGSVARRMVLAR